MQRASAQRGDVMGEWRAYALSRITPDYSWAANEAAQQAAPTVRERVASGGPDGIAIGQHGRLRLQVRWRPQALAARPQLSGDRQDYSTPMLGSLATPFSGSTTRTGLSELFGQHGRVDLGVVMVQQRFAAPFLSGQDYSVMHAQPGLFAAPASSRGTGLEVSMRDRLLPGLDWFAGYRSRVNMDSFKRYQGLYGNPGDLDVPARMRAGLAWQAAGQTQLRVGVQRIKYSDIRPFISTNLPRRLLAVLGDATSPEFQWRDLDMYTLSLAHAFNARNRFRVRYTTRQQPEATSDLLTHILLREAADYSVGLAFEHESHAMQWRLMANYAPAEFVLGMPGGAWRRQHASVRQLEFESLWMWRF